MQNICARGNGQRIAFTKPDHSCPRSRYGKNCYRRRLYQPVQIVRALSASVADSRWKDWGRPVHLVRATRFLANESRYVAYGNFHLNFFPRCRLAHWSIVSLIIFPTSHDLRDCTNLPCPNLNNPSNRASNVWRERSWTMQDLHGHCSDLNDNWRNLPHFRIHLMDFLH